MTGPSWPEETAGLTVTGMPETDAATLTSRPVLWWAHDLVVGEPVVPTG